MKIYQAFAFLSIFIILFYNCSLPTDDKEKGDSENLSASDLNFLPVLKLHRKCLLLREEEQFSPPPA